MVTAAGIYGMITGERGNENIPPFQIVPPANQEQEAPGKNNPGPQQQNGQTKNFAKPSKI